MRKSRAVVLTALVSSAAVIMAACSTPGQSDTTTTAATTPSAAESSATGGGSATSEPTGSASASTSATGGAGTAGDCAGTPHGAYDDPGAATGAVTVGYNEISTSFNGLTGHGNSVYNSNAMYLLQAQASYYDKDLTLVNNDSFITCETVSEDPLTVKYTVNADAKWSDGVPVDANDILLAWIAQSGNFNTAEAEYDEDGNLIPSTDNVSFDASSPGLALIKDFPEMSDDNKSITFVYSEPFVDYKLTLVGQLVPAHVVAQKALEITDATEANAALVKAAQDKDKASLIKIANFWNTGFDATSLPSDPALYLSNGPYMLTDWAENQFMTFKVNPDYTWGPKPAIEQITIQYAPDPTAAVQSLANGELQIIEPQATADVLKGLQAQEPNGITTVNGNGGTYEHVDLVFDNGGPFDPKTYGGDEDKAKAVRLAFLKAIPRQEIIDRLIKPLNPEATVRDSYQFVAGAPGYDEVTAANGMADAFNGNIDEAKKILADAGVSTTTPIDVRFMYADNNPRRANEYQLIANAAKEVGFNVVDGKNADWSSQLSNTKIYDASLFGWQNTTTGVSQMPPNYLGNIDGAWAGQNNFGHYNNEDVNTWMTDLNTTTETDAQVKLISDTEAQLVADGFGTTIFQHPDIVGFDSTKVTGVGSIPVVPAVFYNFWEWKIAG
ncbi:ABC transporter family substrate-binding protein [Nakamurella sp. YIM 132087]|uniref:ABC transporter family substrate-binding protein n=1 Tax=Nakamurella alba TaxID=2665158 RepID=A0A7K1FFM6_9ACTN|nr:ABC transporter family substrate-binding protein [Nakamurella alba]MTD12921.1 ABC transporter family substrate-binding protein [Nakamurella alba]